MSANLARQKHLLPIYQALRDQGAKDGINYQRTVILAVECYPDWKVKRIDRI